MTIPVTSDIQVLDHLLALNLNIGLWSARRKLSPEDFGGVELPPEDVASLGSKRICDPARLCVFSTLKARAFSFLDRHGIRFLGGWGIPEGKAGDVIAELCSIRDEFNREKETFLDSYDEAIADWIAKHPRWATIIAASTVNGEYVRSRLNFSWQLYRVAPPVGLPDGPSGEQAMLHCGLHEEVEGVAGTLFGEIAKDADEIWKKVYTGKSSVTHKALSPLRALRQKLSGLSFVEPHVAPVADLVETALARTPRKGNIVGADLLMLQGLVCLLREPDALIPHAHKLLEGQGAEDVLDDIVNGVETEHTEKKEGSDGASAEIPPADDGADGDCPILFPGKMAEADVEGDSPRFPPDALPVLSDSFGLW